MPGRFDGWSQRTRTIGMGKRGPKPRSPVLTAKLGALKASGAPRFKRTALTTVARRRKQPIKQIVKPQLGGLPSYSKFMLARNPSPRVKAMKRVGAENYYVSNNATQILIQEGYQNAQFYSWQNFADCTNILSKVPGTSPSGPAPKQFVFESTTAEFLMTNSSLATLYVDIYDIVRKRDPGYYAGDPSQDPGNNPTRDPQNAWKYGVSDQSTAFPDMAAWQNINSLPTDSRLFRDYFKIVKRSHVALSQGSTHRHHVMLRPNMLVDSELVTRSNGDLTGLATYTMIVAYGQPASVKTDAGAIVTTASGALDIVVAAREKYTYVQDNTVLWNVVDNLSTLAGEQIVSVGAGTIVPNDRV